MKEELGCCSNNVEANLYKLLVYEEGGHFKPHRDSEKEDGEYVDASVLGAKIILLRYFSYFYPFFPRPNAIFAITAAFSSAFVS